MSEITLVTAYFDIGRGLWKKQERDNNKYIEYFRFWARIKNRLIIYTTEEFREEIYEIRKSFGLEDRTKNYCYKMILEILIRKCIIK